MAENKKTTFWQQQADGLWRRTTVEVATTNHTYIAVHGLPVEYEGLKINDFHLCGVPDGLPMHFAANLAYFVGEGDWAAVQRYLPSLDGDAARALFMEVTQILNLINDLDVPDHVRKTLREDTLDTVKHNRRVVEAQEAWRDGLSRLLAIVRRTDNVWLTPNDLGDSHCTIDGAAWPCTVEPGDQGGYPCLEIDTGDEQYLAFRDAGEAGRAARDYWRDLAEDDPKEFASLVGEQTLVQWGLGNSAGPGYTAVNSLEEWLDLWLDTPEENWATYDHKECELQLCPELVDEHGEYAVAYRTN